MHSILLIHQLHSVIYLQLSNFSVSSYMINSFRCNFFVYQYFCCVSYISISPRPFLKVTILIDQIDIRPVTMKYKVQLKKIKVQRRLLELLPWGKKLKILQCRFCKLDFALVAVYQYRNFSSYGLLLVVSFRFKIVI